MEPSAYLDMAAVEDRHWWFTGRRKILAAMIVRMGLRPGTEILELGSGTGGNLPMLSRFGAVTGVEMDVMAQEISQARCPSADVRAGRLPDELSMADRRFGLICLFDVLEHIEDDAATLRTIKAHLAPDGVFLLTVPAHQALFGPHDIELHHKRRYAREELRTKLLAAGFTVERLSYINSALFPLAWILRWFDKILGQERPTGTGLPSRLVNQVLGAIFGAEAVILPRCNLPFGLSLIAIAKHQSSN